MLSTAPSLSGRGVQGSRWRRRTAPLGRRGCLNPLPTSDSEGAVRRGSGHPRLATTLQAGSATGGAGCGGGKAAGLGLADQVQLQLPLPGARPRVGDADSGSGKRCPKASLPGLPDARSLTVQPAGDRAGRSEKSNSSPEVQEGPKEGCLGGAQTLAGRAGGRPPSRAAS